MDHTWTHWLVERAVVSGLVFIGLAVAAACWRGARASQRSSLDDPRAWRSPYRRQRPEEMALLLNP